MSENIFTEQSEVSDVISILEKIKGEGCLEITSDVWALGGTTIKIKKGKKYFLVATGDSKCQIVFNSKTSDEKTVTDRLTEMLSNSDKPYLEISEGGLLSEKLSEKLNSEVSQFTKSGETLFRVKQPAGFKSLSISGDGKNIASASFDDILEYPKNITLENITLEKEKYLKSIESRFDKMGKILSVLHD